ncbi:caspase family protein [Planctomicrobium sp. SH661]|uniref:caspase family protein n=1 Tax=Planctomicrobium sp. SH661 TaxID=3448124 RepID=UPI003F5C76C1
MIMEVILDCKTDRATRFSSHKTILWGIICHLALVIPTRAQEPAAPTWRKLAVVVGINAYRANSNLPKLNHSVADATKLNTVLRQAGFTVFEMTHEMAGQPGKAFLAPNLDYIRDQISGVLEYPNLGEDDAVLISLHGHGVSSMRLMMLTAERPDSTSVRRVPWSQARRRPTN